MTHAPAPTPAPGHGPLHAPTPTEVDALDAVVEPMALEVSSPGVAEARRRELRERIAVLGVPLADGIAVRYRGRGIDTDDLVQVARTALVKAVHRYRPGAGPGFAAYAIPTISGELKRWFRDHGWAVRPPRRLQELRVLIAAEEEHLGHTLGRRPGDADLAIALGVSREEIAEARVGAAAYQASSLDEPGPAGSPVVDLVLVAEGPAASVETRDALRRSMARLTERQRVVLGLRFVDELTQSEIGRHVGVSQMQVSRILRGALATLRADLADAEALTHAQDLDDTPRSTVGGSAA